MIHLDFINEDADDYARFVNHVQTIWGQFLVQDMSYREEY